MLTYAAASKNAVKGDAMAPQLEVTTSSAFLPVNDSVQVPVTVIRTNYSGTVTFQAVGLPTGVTAVFNPSSLSGNQSLTTMTLTSDLTSDEADTTVTVDVISAQLRSAAVIIAVQRDSIADLKQQPTWAQAGALAVVAAAAGAIGGLLR